MALNKVKCYYLLYGSNPSKSAVSVGRMKTIFITSPNRPNRAGGKRG